MAKSKSSPSANIRSTINRKRPVNRKAIPAKDALRLTSQASINPTNTTQARIFAEAEWKINPVKSIISPMDKALR